MPTIRITDEAMAALRSMAEHDFDPHGVRNPDGFWTVPISLEVLERLVTHIMNDESWSDVIIRIIKTRGGVN